MKKEIWILIVAVAVAVCVVVGGWRRSNTRAFAAVSDGPHFVSTIDSMVSGANPGAWVVVGNKLYLVRADYDFNTKQWSIKQLASADMGASVR